MQQQANYHVDETAKGTPTRAAGRLSHACHGPYYLQTNVPSLLALWRGILPARCPSATQVSCRDTTAGPCPLSWVWQARPTPAPVFWRGRGGARFPLHPVPGPAVWGERVGGRRRAKCGCFCAPHTGGFVQLSELGHTSAVDATWRGGEGPAGLLPSTWPVVTCWWWS